MAAVTTTALALALAAFAPSILRFFGVGEKPIAVATKVIDIAKAVTGTTSIDEAISALRSNPELAHQFNIAAIAADAELEKLVSDDRKDARARDVELRKLTRGKNRRQDLMIIGDWLGLISCVVAAVLFKSQMSGEVFTIVSMITMHFLNNLKNAHGFEFGSSRSSQNKDDVIGDIARMP